MVTVIKWQPPIGLFLGGFLIFVLPFIANAQIKDLVTFGDNTSEQSHTLQSSNTQVIAGALNQTARQCLAPLSSNIYGGTLTFNMSVDSVYRNYFSLKLWGEDDGVLSSTGRLYLYVIQNGINYQVGYRHEGDYTCMSVQVAKAPLPGRFYYSTTLLPLWVTKGKTSVTLRIVSTGRLYGLGSGGPPNGNYQYYMTEPSRGIYRAYTHISPYLDVSNETQGSAPTTTVMPTPTESVINAGGSYFNSVNSRINSLLNTAPTITNFSTESVEYLAKSYFVKNLAGYQNAAVVNKVVSVIDAYTQAFYNDNKVVSSGGNEGWGGRFGYLGYAIYMLRNQIGNLLDVQVNYGSAVGFKSRRAAWGDILTASRDTGRAYRDGRFITNQCILANVSIYKANKALLALADARALSEPMAQRYLKESVGLSPFLGNDVLSNNTSSLIGGSAYYQVTTKGLSREMGYVGISYGEMQQKCAYFYKLCGNEIFKQQSIIMLNARAPFRRPAIQKVASAYYIGMEGIGLLAWRGRGEVDGDYSNEVAYGDRVGEFGPLMVAATTLDSTAIAYAKQCLADNQFFTILTSTFAATPAGLDVFDDYVTIKNAFDKGTRLPMSDGQPNFVWADEENGIVAIKKDSERLWIAPYWQSKAQSAVNGIARFHYSASNYDQYGVLETNPLFTFSGQWIQRPNFADGMGENEYTPPDNPINIYAGEKLPIAYNGSRIPTSGLTASNITTKDAPFVGKVDAYAFRFGRFLIGMNCSRQKSFTLKVPNQFTSAINLVNSTTVTNDFPVSNLNTSVLYLNSAIDSAPVPTAPLLLYISSFTTNALRLIWRHSSGAIAYSIRRSLTAGGPYTTLVSGLTDSTYLDNSIVPLTNYYYVVVATNANGESYPSHEVSNAGFSPDLAACINTNLDTAYLRIPYTFTLAATNSPSSFSASGLPSGLSLNSQNGVISGTPTSTGNFSVSFTITNIKGSTTTNYQLVVANPPALSFTSPDSANAFTGIPFSYIITADGNPISFNATSMPSGFVVDTLRGLIRGTFSSNGTFNFTIRVASANASITKNLTIVVSNPPIPVITNTASLTTVTNDDFYFAINATNNPSVYKATNLPTGLNIDTLSGLISGKPTVAGTFTVTLSAKNSSGTATSNISVIVLGALIAPWRDTSIGSGDGYASYDATNGRFLVAGSGNDIGGTIDGFNFAYQPIVSNNCTITGRILSRQIANCGCGTPLDKFGIMMREELDSSALFFFVFVDAQNNVRCAYRSSKGGSVSYLTTLAYSLPAWLRIVRQGNRFTGFASTDSITWTNIGTITLSFNSNMHVGMAVTSRVTNLNLTTFDRISITGSGFRVSNWTGAQNTDWFNSANWDNGVPDTTTRVCVPAGLSNYPIISTAATALQLLVNNSASITINNGGYLMMYGNVIDSGTIGGSGYLAFAASARLEGTGYISNLVDTIGTLTLNSDFDIGTLRLANNAMLANEGFTLEANGSVSITNTAVHSGAGKLRMIGAGTVYAAGSTAYQGNLEIDCGTGNTIFANNSTTSVVTSTYYRGDITILSGTFTLNGNIYVGLFNASTTHSIAIADGAVLNTFNDKSNGIYGQGNTINVVNNGRFGQAGTTQFRSHYFWCQSVKNLNFTGSGVYSFGGISSDNNCQSLAVSIASNMTLYGGSSTLPALGLQLGSNQNQSPSTTDTRSITIAPNVSVIVRGGWIGSNAVNTALVPPTTYNILGTLDASSANGIGLVTTSNTTFDVTGALSSITVNLGATGVFRCPATVYTGEAQPATQNFWVNVTTGGLITYSGTSYTATRNNGVSGTSSLITVKNSNIQFLSTSTLTLINDSTFAADSLSFAGSVNLSGAGSIGNLTVTNGTFTFASNYSTGNITTRSGTTLSDGGNTITVNGDLLCAGGLTNNGGISVNGNVNYSNTSADATGTGRVIMTGANKTFSSLTKALGSLEIACGSGNTITTTADVNLLGNTLTITSGTFSIGGRIQYWGTTTQSITVRIASGATLTTTSNNAQSIIFNNGQTITFDNNGIFGAASATGLTNRSFQVYFKAASITTVNFNSTSGAGVYIFGGFSSDNNAKGYTVNVNRDMTLFGGNSTVPTIGFVRQPTAYTTSNWSTYTTDIRRLTITSGVTVTVTNGFVGDYVNTSTGALNTSTILCPLVLDVQGTLDCSNANTILALINTSYDYTANSATPNSLTVNIGANGVLRCPARTYRQASPRNIANQLFIVNVASGGKITYAGTAYTTTRTAITSGTTVTSLTTYSLITTGASAANSLQNIDFAAGVTISNDSTFVANNLTLAGVATFNGSGTETVNGTLTLGGKVTLGASKQFTLGANALVSGSSSSNYVDLSNGAALIRKQVSSSSILFPIGLSARYSPLVLTSTTGTPDITVRLQSSFTNAVNDASKMVNLQWAVNASTQQTTNILFQFNTADFASGFSASGVCEVGNYKTTAYQTIASGLLSGNNPYTFAANNCTLPASGNNFFVIGNQSAILTCSIGSYTGTNGSNANDANNWCNATLPNGTINVVISGVTPTLSSDLTVNNLVMTTGLILNGYNLTVNGTLTGSGLLTGSPASTLNVKGKSNVQLSNTTDGTTNALKNLVVNSNDTVFINNKLFIYNFLHPQNGVLCLGDSDVVLRSGSDGVTAQVSQVDASIRYLGAGRFVAERYIHSNRRGYRNFCSGGIVSDGSIFDNWQEKGASIAGYGTHITGIKGFTATFDATTGLDYTISGAPSLWKYNNNDAFVAVTNTKQPTTKQLLPFEGYFGVIRGDRTYNMFTNAPNFSLANTVLRTRGKLLTGNLLLSSNNSTVNYVTDITQQANFSLNGNTTPVGKNDANFGFSLVGNPYACAIDWNSLYARSNGVALSNGHLSPYYWVWNQSVNSGNGAFVTVSNGGVVNVSPTDTVKANNSFIQPGQSFFIQNDHTGSPVYLSFSEQDKWTANLGKLKANFDVENLVSGKISIQLFKQLDTVAAVTDGCVVLCNSDNNNGIDIADAGKMSNPNENLAIDKRSKLLSIENRKYLAIGDTLYLKGWNLAPQQTYRLNINIANPVSSCVLQLINLADGKAITLPQTGVVDYQFSTDSSTSTSFVIAPVNPTILPIAGVELKGIINNNRVNLNWHFPDAALVKTLSLMKWHGNMNNSSQSNTLLITSNPQVNQSFTDTLSAAPSFYQLSLQYHNGRKTLSNIFMTNPSALTAQWAKVEVLGNPTRAQNIVFTLKNMSSGAYEMVLVDAVGKIQNTYKLQHQQHSLQHYRFPMGGKTLTSGVYFLMLLQENQIKSCEKLLINND